MAVVLSYFLREKIRHCPARHGGRGDTLAGTAEVHRLGHHHRHHSPLQRPGCALRPPTSAPPMSPAKLHRRPLRFSATQLAGCSRGAAGGIPVESEGHPSGEGGFLDTLAGAAGARRLGSHHRHRPPQWLVRCHFPSLSDSALPPPDAQPTRTRPCRSKTA